MMRSLRNGGKLQRNICKEVGEDLAQHRVDERNFKYKLEIYQKKNPKFLYGSPTNIESLSQDEENKIGPNGIAQEEEVHTEEPQEFRRGGQEGKKPQIAQE